MNTYYNQFKDNPFSESLVLNRPLNLIQCFAAFYMLQSLEAEFNIEPEHIYSHLVQRYLKDFADYKALFNKKFAGAIYDYTVTAVAGELRHFNTEARLYSYRIDSRLVGIPAYNSEVSELRKSKLYQEDFGNEHTRTYIYKHIIYTPQSILDVASYCFDENIFRWHTNFGGNKWKAIAEAGKLYNGNLNIFIDHTADLQHNGGTYFDKEETRIFLSFSNYQISDLLDIKRSAMNMGVLFKEFSKFLDSKIIRLFERFLEIHQLYGKDKSYIRHLKCIYTDYIKPFKKEKYISEKDINMFFLFNYKRKRFGNIELRKSDVKIVPHGKRIRDLPHYWGKY